MIEGWRITHTGGGYWEITHPGIKGALRVADALGTIEGLRDLLNHQFPAIAPEKASTINRIEDRIIEIERRERREKIATAVLSGFAREETPHVHEAPHLVGIAVKLADLLIAKLDESEP